MKEKRIIHYKKDFYLLLGAKYEADSYLISVFYHWQKDNLDTKPVHYKNVEVVGWFPRQGDITLRFNNDDALEFTIPATYFHEPDDTEHPVMLWYSDYYDGPISGLADYAGKKVWFQCLKFEYENIHGTRSFGFYELSDEEVEYEENWHQYFRDTVGHHCDYIEGFHGHHSYNKESFDEFYKNAKD